MNRARVSGDLFARFPADIVVTALHHVNETELHRRLWILRTIKTEDDSEIQCLQCSTCVVIRSGPVRLDKNLSPLHGVLRM